MASRISELVLDCEDPERLAAFWSAVLDYVELGREPDGGIEIGPASGFGGLQPTLILSPSTDPKPARIHKTTMTNATGPRHHHGKAFSANDRDRQDVAMQQ